jgi:hypothetical protein
MHHEQDSLSDCAESRANAAHVDYAVFAKHQARIGEDARCGFKIDSRKLRLI